MSTAWDEEISAYLQEEELLDVYPAGSSNAQCDPHGAPLPDDLPLPFGAAVLRESLESVVLGERTAALVYDSTYEDLARQCEEEAPPREEDPPPDDWLSKVIDKRVLRRASSSGRSALGYKPVSWETSLGASVSSSSGSSPSTSSSSSWCPPKSTTGASLTGVTSATGATSSSSFSSSSSSSSQSSAGGGNVTVEGVTTRWGVKRPGRDRWHNPDGSLINRGRDRGPLPASGGDGSLAPVPEDGPMENQGTPHEATENMRDSSSSCSGGKSFYGREFLVKNATGIDSGESTTAGEESEDPEGPCTSSSGASSCPDGFWRHGKWVNRPRTPSELRSHRGGGGPRRAQRRHERVQQYLRGDWRPKWLEDYVAQRKQREALAGEKLEEETTSGQLAEATTPELPPQPADEVVEGTDPPAQNLQTEWEWRSNGWWSSLSSSSSWEPWWSSSSSWSSSWTWWNPGEQDRGEVEDDEESPQENVEEWPWPGDDNSSSMATTSSTTSTSHLPNYGLFPDVSEQEVEDADAVWMMQLTNAERALLQESGVPPATVSRMETLLETMDRQQAEGRGAEGRWALGCFLHRAADGLEALDRIVGVLQRRLLPRGYVPIRRVPNNEQLRWSLFQWGRKQRDILQGTLDRHLDVGLIPADSDLAPGEGHVGGGMEDADESPASLVATEAAPSTPVEAVSITPTTSRRERAGRGEVASSSSDHTSDVAVGSNGELVTLPMVEPDLEAAPRGPPPPQPVGTLASALEGGLHGVWYEPPVERTGDDASVNGEHEADSASSSSSSCSGPSAREGGNGETPPASTTSTTSTTTLSCTSTWTTTSSSTSSTSTLSSPSIWTATSSSTSSSTSSTSVVSSNSAAGFSSSLSTTTSNLTD